MPLTHEQPFAKVAEHMYAAGLSIRPLRTRHPRQGLGPFRRWLLVLGLVVLAGWLAARVAFGGGPEDHQTVVVQPGDSLWSIASARYPGADPRERVDAIEQLNHLGGPTIVPGETLELPPA